MQQAITILVPVFFMLALGHISRLKNWLTYEQKNGANALVFQILFPILIFDLTMTANLAFSTLSIVGFVLLAFLLALVVGKWTAPFTGKEKAHFTPYLLSTVEGGSVALPLFLSIVGKGSTTVIFDLAGAALAFFILPVLLSRVTAKSTNAAQTIKSIFSHPFVVATVLGLLANALHLSQILAGTVVGDIYAGIIGRATAPIVGIILFVLGYDLYVNKETLLSVARLAVVRVGFYLLVILGFFLIFPDFMSVVENKIAVLIYFMCPTGFALPSIIAPIFKSEEEVQFASTFISLYMLISLVAYSCVVLFLT